MKNENLNRILWLSDIHFSAEYEKIKSDPSFSNYLTHFLTKIKRENSLKPIDYIFITGDLAQMGIKSDYECLWNNFLKKLLDIFLDQEFKTNSIPKIITIPGNHDVKWDNAGFLKEYIAALAPKSEPKPDRNKFLKSQPESFIALFNDYTAFLTKDVLKTIDKKYRSFFDLTNQNVQLQVSNNYLENRLCGHLIDHSRKMIFILLNSAWYSLGDKFNKLFAEKIVADPDYDKTAKFFEDMLSQKDLISEYNNQVSGITQLNLESVHESFSHFTDYVTISCIHHPMNWLAWDQYYTYGERDNEIANIFNDVMNKSDVLLSGHEHVPSRIAHDTVFKNTIHLKGGCFLFDKQHEVRNFSNGWFSILDIDPYKGNLLQTKYYFNNEKNIENWQSRDAPLINLVKKNDKYLLHKKREERIFDQLDSLRTKSKLFNYLSEYGLVNCLEGDLKLVASSQATHAFLFSVSSDDKLDLYFLATGKDYYISITNKIMNKEIQDILIRAEGKTSTIRFLVLDLLTDKNAVLRYQEAKDNGEPKRTRQESLQLIAKKADVLFDWFRLSFFNPFEPMGNLPVSSVKKLGKFKDIRFVNHVIPYWIFEKFWVNFGTSSF